MKAILSILSFAFLISFTSCSDPAEQATQDYYQLQFYSLDSLNQGPALENYLEHAYLPALRRAGIDQVGAFKTIEGKNGEQKLIVVFIPLSSLSQIEKLPQALERDEIYIKAAEEYAELPHNAPPYLRMESTLMKAFSTAPEFHTPELLTNKSERIYELRSYHSATEKLHNRKVEMFDSGETELFVELGFQPMFFGKVISGAEMPNLMYMTCHADSAAQADNWNAFRVHPTWTELKGMQKYAHTVSHIDIWLVYPTAYSDL